MGDARAAAAGGDPVRLRRLFAPGAVALAAAVAVAGPLAPAPALGQAQKQQDWTRYVAATPEGGFRLGNPDAPVKLIEFGSMTCPTCAHFAEEGVPPLVGKYVKSGKVSFEFRNYPLNGIDVVATLLARCAGTSDFFAVTDRLYRTQKQWAGKLYALTEEQKAGLKALPPAAQMVRMADIGGLTAIAAQAGLPAAKAKQCLAAPDALAGLDRMKQAAEQSYGVRGTPTFVINGARNYAHHWPDLEPLILAAGG